MTDNETFTDAVAFFREHAGSSHDPRRETASTGSARGARELAAAEQYASAAGWSVVIDHDADGPMDDDAGSVESVAAGDAVCLDVRMTDADGETLASLGNVIVASESDAYVRVVAAELALEAMPDAPSVHMLRSGSTWGNESDARSLRAGVFGHLVERAAPVVKHYRSDLFHDAAWLTEHVTEPGTFYWACGESGTTIGTDPRYVVHGPLVREHAYRVVIDADRETTFYVTLTREPR